MSKKYNWNMWDNLETQIRHTLGKVQNIKASMPGIQSVSLGIDSVCLEKYKDVENNLNDLENAFKDFLQYTKDNNPERVEEMHSFERSNPIEKIEGIEKDWKHKQFFNKAAMYED